MSQVDYLLIPINEPDIIHFKWKFKQTSGNSRDNKLYIYVKFTYRII